MRRINCELTDAEYEELRSWFNRIRVANVATPGTISESMIHKVCPEGLPPKRKAALDAEAAGKREESSLL